MICRGARFIEQVRSGCRCELKGIKSNRLDFLGALTRRPQSFQSRSYISRTIYPRHFIVVGLGHPGKEYADSRQNVGFKVLDTFQRDLLPGMFLCRKSKSAGKTFADGGQSLESTWTASAGGGESMESNVDEGSPSFRTERIGRYDSLECIVDFDTADKNLGLDITDERVARRRAKTLREGVTYPEAKVSLVKPLALKDSCGEALINFLAVEGLTPTYKRLKNNVRKLNILPELLVVYDDVTLPVGEVRLNGKGGAGTHIGLDNVFDCVGMKLVSRLRIGIKPRDIKECQDPEKLAMERFNMEEQDIILESLNFASKVLRVYIHRGFDMAMNACNNFD